MTESLSLVAVVVLLAFIAAGTFFIVRTIRLRTQERRTSPPADQNSDNEGGQRKSRTGVVLGVLLLLLVLSGLTSHYIGETDAGNVLFLTAGIAILVLIIIILLANLDAYLSLIEQGTTAFFNKGESMYEIVPNVDGHLLSTDVDAEGRRWLVPEEVLRQPKASSLFRDSLSGTVWLQEWLWDAFGVKAITLWWPQIRRHHFDVSRKRIRERTDVKAGSSLRERVAESGEPSTVSHLLFIVPRPLYLEGLELAGDNSRVNLLLLPIYRQVIPSLPVYYYKGDFFPPLDAAIEAAMVDFFATHRVAVHKGKDNEGQFAHDTYGVPYNPPQPPSYNPPENEEEKRAYDEQYAADVRKYRRNKNKYDRKYKKELEEYKEKYDPSPLTYAHWLKIAKAGDESPIERHLRRLNASREYLSELRKEGRTELADYVDRFLTHESEGPADMIEGETAKQIPSGIVPRFGFALVSFRVVDWEAHASTQALAAALLAQETNFHTAQGVREEAYGIRDAINARAEGESARYQRLVRALTEEGVSEDMAAEVVRTQLRTENVRDSKLTTYVEGAGTGTSLLVNPPPPST